MIAQLRGAFRTVDAKISDSVGFIGTELEQRFQTRDLQSIAKLLRHRKQLESAAGPCNCGITAEEFTQARTVKIGHIPEVQKELLAPVPQFTKESGAEPV